MTLSERLDAPRESKADDETGNSVILRSKKHHTLWQGSGRWRAGRKDIERRKSSTTGCRHSREGPSSEFSDFDC